ncbi:MAG: PQQ-like beta-propeller repeat protein [Planctomycetia bacterium]|nr:PQQ-like beta-propeller repeat protein [Planctomycetia bacterium]
MKRIALSLGLWFVAAVAWGASDDFPTLKLQNWHQWRGPLATGVAPLGNPPTTWDENTNIKWKAKIPGKSTATPIVWGDQIFLITAIKTDRQIELPPAAADAPKNPFNIQRPKNFYQFVVMSVDRRTGETRWQQIAKEEVPHEGHHPDGSFASASAMTDGKQIYVSFGSRGVYCYDLQGNQKWSRDLGKMTIYNSFGEGTSPVVHGDSVIVNWDHQGGSFITLLDATTGETKWKVDREENTSWATPLVMDHNGRTQVIVNGTKRVRSYDLNSGEVIWECGGQVLAAIPCPVSDGQLAFAMTGYTGNALYAIPLDSTGDITDTDKIAWKRKDPGTPYVPSPLLYGDLLYFTGSNRGILSCLNAKTGEPVIDRKRLEGIANIYASPVGAADRIYLTSRDGTTLVIKKGPELEILSTNKLDDGFEASGVIVGSQIFLRGRENLYCISAE